MRRSRLDIIIDVLDQISLHRGCVRSNLMVYANISFTTLYDVTEFLEDRGMICYAGIRRKRCVFIEPKGSEWLRNIKGLLRQIDYAEKY